MAVSGPSDIPFSDQYPSPVPMSEEEILRVENAFVQAIERCKQVGCMLLSSHVMSKSIHA